MFDVLLLYLSQSMNGFETYMHCTSLNHCSLYHILGFSSDLCGVNANANYSSVRASKLGKIPLC